MIRAVVVLAALAAPAARAEPPAGAVAEIEAGREECDAYGGGGFEVGDALVELDLSGDGAPDALIDQSRLRCAGAPSYWCGSGGCGLVAIVEGTRSDWLVKAWSLAEVEGRPVLLVRRHGMECGGTLNTFCVEALSWSPDIGGFATVAPPPRD